MRRSTDKKQQSKGSKGIEDPNQDKRSRKLLRVYKLLPKIYQKLQLYSKISQQAQTKKGMKIGKEISRSIWKIKREDYKSTHTYPTEKRRKILSRNKCVRTCHRRSSILEVRRKIETYCVFIRNNATCQKKLWDLWQRTTHHSRSSHKMKTIYTRHHRKVWSLDGSWKSQIFPGTA